MGRYQEAVCIHDVRYSVRAESARIKWLLAAAGPPFASILHPPACPGRAGLARPVWCAPIDVLNACGKWAPPPSSYCGGGTSTP